MSDTNEYESNDFISSSSENTEAPVPSAPTTDDNGYIVVNENTQNSEADLAEARNNQTEIGNLIAEINASNEAQLKESSNTVLAEADSSVVGKEDTKPEQKTQDKKECSMCPYYLLGTLYLLNKSMFFIFN